jgi:hypothetical protein
MACLAQIDELPSYLRAVCQEDINGDEMTDLIALDDLGGLLYHLNEGDNTYGDAVHISTSGFTFHVGVQVVDLDGDGDMDIVRSDQSVVLIYMNDGNANFSSTFSDHVFVQDYLGSEFLVNDVCTSFAPMVTDRNTDGLVDLTWALGICTYNEFLEANVYETICLTINGNQQGGFGPQYQMSFVTPPVDVSTPDVLITSRLVDVDDNGTDEIVFQFITQSFSTQGGVTQTYSSGQWFPEFAMWTEEEPRQFRTGDVDGDGDKDIMLLLAGFPNARFQLHLNDGSGGFDDGTDILVGNGLRDFDMADFDQDGDMDLFAISNGGSQILYEQVNLGVFQSEVLGPVLSPDYLNIELIRNEQNEAVAIIAIAANVSHVYGLAPCIADLSGDGIVNIADFLVFNSAFGTSCSCCPADLNGDGLVDIADFLILNSSFGVTCP